MRIDKEANVQSAVANAEALKAAGTPTISCPTVANRLPAVPQRARTEVDRNLELMERQIAEANRRLARSGGEGGPNFVNNAILGPLRSKRVATLDRIAIAIGRNAPRPTGLLSLARCDVSNAGPGGNSGELPGVQGPNLELAGNIGGIVRPQAVKIEYRRQRNEPGRTDAEVPQGAHRGIEADQSWTGQRSRDLDLQRLR